MVLSIHSITGPLTFLSSLKNGLITVYDVSRGNDHLTHCHSVPTSLLYNGDMGALDSESTFVVQPDMSSFSLLRLSSQGSLHCQDFAVCRNDMDMPPRQNIVTSHEWSADVQKLAQKAKGLQPQYGPLSARHFSELNLRPAYESERLRISVIESIDILIFNSDVFHVRNPNEQTAQGELVEMMSKLSQFSQRTNDSDKAMLTL